MLRPRGAGLAAGGPHTWSSVPARPLGRPPPGETRRSPRSSPSLFHKAKRPQLAQHGVSGPSPGKKRGFAPSSTPTVPCASPACLLGAGCCHCPLHVHLPCRLSSSRTNAIIVTPPPPPCTVGTFSVSVGQLLWARCQHIYYVLKLGDQERALC